MFGKLATLLGRTARKTVDGGDFSKAIESLQQSYNKWGDDFYDHIGAKGRDTYDRIIDSIPNDRSGRFTNPITGEQEISFVAYPDRPGFASKPVGSVPVAGRPDEVMAIEYSDSAARYNTSKLADGGKHKLSDVMSHPTMFKVYPEMADMPVVARSFGDKGTNMGGSYNYKNRSILLNKDKIDDDLSDHLLHEVQHGIDDLARVDHGANPSDVVKKVRQINELPDLTPSNAEAIYNNLNTYEAERGYYPSAVRANSIYWNNLGEVNARNVAARRYLSAAKLKNTPFYQGANDVYMPDVWYDPRSY